MNKIVLHSTRTLLKNMIRFLIAVFICCSAVACVKAAEKVHGFSTDKIDPLLRVEIEKSKSIQQASTEVAVLIRTKKEVNDVEKGAIEKEGGRIGSVIGDILTARIPVGAISKIADFDFVVYIEGAKKQQLR